MAAIDTLLPLLLQLGVSVAFANVTLRDALTVRSTASHVMLAAIAAITALLMPMLLERALRSTERSRPACAAGIVWMLTYLLAVVFAGIAEGLQCSRGADEKVQEALLDDMSGHAEGLQLGESVSAARSCTADRIKWLMVCSYSVAFALNVALLILQSRCGLTPNSLRCLHLRC